MIMFGHIPASCRTYRRLTFSHDRPLEGRRQRIHVMRLVCIEETGIKTNMAPIATGATW
jgi:hypothetical protein